MGKRKTTAEFIRDAISVHGDKYDYSRVTYVNNQTPVEIVCPLHGSFKQKPVRHTASKRGCRRCGVSNTRVRKTTDQFIEEAVLKHGGAYDYSKTIYTKCDSEIIITCPKHGDFKTTPARHLHAIPPARCGECTKESRHLTRSLGRDEFIKRCIGKHGNLYDYFLVDYKSLEDKVSIVCDRHGVFEQTAGCHINGSGCPTCANEKAGSYTRKDTNYFVERAKKIHGSTYDYSESEYRSFRDKIKIICRKHGPFMQLPTNHYAGSGCPECATALINRGYVDRYDRTNLYLIAIQTEACKFLKVGLSINIEERITTLRRSAPYKRVDIQIVRFINGPCEVLYKAEQEIHSDPNLKHYWGKRFEGFTECYKFSEIKNLNVKFSKLQEMLGSVSEE